jgi:hypothetical protein
MSQVAIAEQSVFTGIMRAKTVLGKKRTAFYHSLPALVLAGTLITATYSHAQEITRHEGILIDVSGSIGRGGENNERLNEYLRSAKQLLATEPPNSRVWVSVITTDSFGGVRELMKGWTPGTQGVFTDNLNRARRQLAANFETKSSGLSPAAAGTDIIGALWLMKALLDSPSGEAVMSSKAAVEPAMDCFALARLGEGNRDELGSERLRHPGERDAAADAMLLALLRGDVDGFCADKGWPGPRGADPAGCTFTIPTGAVVFPETGAAGCCGPACR